MLTPEDASRNPHEQSDALRVWGRAFFQRMEMEFQERVQGLTNYETMYAEQKALADQRRQDSEIVARICGFISLYDCVVAGQRVDEAVLTVLDEQRAEIVRLRGEVAHLRTPTYHGAYHEDAGVRGVDDV